MKIALLGVKGEFEKNCGKGVQRYIYEMYKRISRAPGIALKKIEYRQLPAIGVGLSFMFRNAFGDLSGFDIIHNPDIKPFYRLVKPRAIRITTAHEFRPLLNPELMVGQQSGIRERIWISAVIKLAYKSLLESDYITANSSQTKEEAISLGFDKDKIFVVNHGLDEKFIRGRLYHKDRTGKSFRVGYIGSLSLGKNVGMAVDAIRSIEDKNLVFEIWGKGSENKKILSRIDRDKRISIKGFVSETDIVKTYDSFDAFVAPSLYEGFGLTILEAQARGLPVIIYKGGKIAKEVRKYCFEAKDTDDMAAIVMRIKENDYDENLRDKATRYARTFTWENTAKGTVAVYKRVFDM